MDKPDRDHRYHFWLVATYDGKPTLVYGGPDENSARQRGMELLPGVDFEIKRLPTISLARASSLIRGNRLEQSHSLKQATQRLGHNKSIALWKRRQEQRRRLRTQ